MKTAPLLALLFLTNLVLGQGRFQLTLHTTDDVIKSVTINLLDNGQLQETETYKATVNDRKVSISGNLTQPCHFAKMTIHNGEFQRYKYFSIDTGINDFNVSLKGNRLMLADTREISATHRLSDVFDSIANSFISRNTKTTINTPTADQASKINSDMLSVIKQNPDEYRSLLQLNHVNGFGNSEKHLRTILETYKVLRSDLQQSALGLDLHERVTNKLKALEDSGKGNPVPIFTVKDLQGKPFTNASLKGEVYLIVFCAVWCVPCQEDLPKFQALYNRYKNKGLKVVYFNDDDNLARWKAHVQTKRLDWINVSEGLKPQKGLIPKRFGVYAIPNYFLVNRQGRIIYNSIASDNRLPELETALSSLYQTSDH